MKILSVIEDVIWHKRHKFYKVQAEMVRVKISEVIISKWRCRRVFVIGQNLLFTTTK